MARRFIGIDVNGAQVRIAVLEGDKGQPRLTSLSEATWQTPEELGEQVRQAIGGASRFGDRFAAALPASACFVRTLSFPFADPKKIEAALPLELSSRLPIALDDFETAYRLAPQNVDGQYPVTGAAVAGEQIEQILAPWESQGIPLHVLDSLPFALAAGLRQVCPNGLLIHFTKSGITLVLLQNGQVEDFRFIPRDEAAEQSIEGKKILREAIALAKGRPIQELEVFLSGSGIDAAILKDWQRVFPKATIPEVNAGNRPATAADLAAIALAWRAALPDKEGEFNFRSGRFALRSEWAALKKGAILAGSILGVALLITMVAAYANYARKADQAEALQKEMTAIYRTTFPQAKVIVDIPMQMRSGLKDLQKQGLFVGAAGNSPLAVLQEVSSRVPEDVVLDVRDFTYTMDNLRLEGVTASFDAINRIARSLTQSPMFGEAQISDAKMSLDGSRVDFRISLPIIGKGEQK